MDTTTAKVSIKNVNRELFSLTPSTLITLFEIDIGDLVTDLQISNSLPTIYRFHGVQKLLNTTIKWQGHDYIAVPIQATGFELSSKGVAPTPRLSITVNESGVSLLSQLKQMVFAVGDAVGSRVTRIRTYAKFLDVENGLSTLFPNLTFAPDANSELPRDIYYIDRKSAENKLFIEYELASVFDVQNVKLPGRIVNAYRCIWTYRGEGCGYENKSRRSVLHTGMTLLDSAPPVSTENNEIITDIIGTSLVDKGIYNISTPYVIGDFIYITKKNINYYFVCKLGNTGIIPPNPTYWISDQCSKSLLGCEQRFKNIRNGALPIGAFPGVSRLIQ